jgi:pectinesterase
MKTVLLYLIGYFTNLLVLETHHDYSNNAIDIPTNSKTINKTKNNIVKQFDDYTIIVDSNGNGDFTSIQEAINNSRSYPDKRITIFIKNGVYFEKVKIHAWNTKVSLIGESKDKTIITYNDHFKKINLGRNSTFHTYTVLAEGNDCIIKNLTIENSSGEVGQAVALNVNANRVIVSNCSLFGNQDTLYTSGENCKNYFKGCYIEGTTDFIFGDATAYFENCIIHSKSNSYITAASTPQNQEFGYVFKECLLTANETATKVYLGRPWRNYAKTVFINCEMGAHILPEGWHNWSKPNAEKTVYYAEYDCKGKGFNPKQRASWSHQLLRKEVKKYTINNILKDKTKDWFLTGS